MCSVDTLTTELHPQLQIYQCMHVCMYVYSVWCWESIVVPLKIIGFGTGKASQRVMALPQKPDDLCSLSRAQVKVEEEDWFHHIVL